MSSQKQTFASKHDSEQIFNGFYAVPSPGYRSKFTPDEDACLLFLVENAPLPKAGNRLYRLAENYGILERSYQSMKNRYKTVIKKMLTGEIERPNVDFNDPRFIKKFIEWGEVSRISNPTSDPFEPKRKRRKTSHDPVDETKHILDFLEKETGANSVTCAKALMKHGYDTSLTLNYLKEIYTDL